MPALQRAHLVTVTVNGGPLDLERYAVGDLDRGAQEPRPGGRGSGARVSDVGSRVHSVQQALPIYTGKVEKNTEKQKKKVWVRLGREGGGGWGVAV